MQFVLDTIKSQHESLLKDRTALWALWALSCVCPLHFSVDVLLSRSVDNITKLDGFIRTPSFPVSVECLNAVFSRAIVCNTI